MTDLSGDVGLPLVGETLPFVRDPVQFVDSHQERHGPVFVSQIIGAPTVFVCSYAGVRQVLCSSDAALDAAQAYAEFVDHLFPSPNVLLLPVHSPQRSRLKGLFYSLLSETAADEFRPVVRTLTQPVIDSLHSSLKLPLYTTFKPLCELIAFAFVLGTQYALEHAGVLSRLATAHFNGIVATPVSLRVMGRRSARARATDAQKHLLGLIQSRINYLRSSNDEKDESMLRKLVDASEGTEDDEVICNHILLLLSAAIPKTMASTLCSLFAQLSRTNRDGVDLRCTIVETLRLHPPLLGGMRTTGKQEGTCIAGKSVPKRHRVWWSARHANRDESVFARADSFIPLRWNGKLNDSHGCPFANSDILGMPFSFGSGERFCPGRFVAWAAIDEVATCLLDHFELVNNSSSDVVEMRYVPVCRSVEDIIVALKPKT